jgi:very-long-chain enoyl-CoA reductase
MVLQNPTRAVIDCLTAPKKPITRLPRSIEITDKTTVQDVKDKLAEQAGGWDPNRFGLFDPEQKKILKDRKALISQSKEVMAGKEVLVKDLGMVLLTYWHQHYLHIIRSSNILVDGLHYRIFRPYPVPPRNSAASPKIHILLRSSTIDIAVVVIGYDRRTFSQTRI